MILNSRQLFQRRQAAISWRQTRTKSMIRLVGGGIQPFCLCLSKTWLKAELLRYDCTFISAYLPVCHASLQLKFNRDMVFALTKVTRLRMDDSVILMTVLNQSHFYRGYSLYCRLNYISFHVLSSSFCEFVTGKYFLLQVKTFKKKTPKHFKHCFTPSLKHPRWQMSHQALSLWFAFNSNPLTVCIVIKRRRAIWNAQEKGRGSHVSSIFTTLFHLVATTREIWEQVLRAISRDAGDAERQVFIFPPRIKEIQRHTLST